MQLGPVLSSWEDTECDDWQQLYPHTEDRDSTRMPAQPKICSAQNHTASTLEYRLIPLVISLRA